MVHGAQIKVKYFFKFYFYMSEFMLFYGNRDAQYIVALDEDSPNMLR